MTQFDTIYNKYIQRISEDMPINLEPGIGVGAGERAPATFTDTANYKITPQQVASVIDSVIDYLQTRNNYSPLPYKDFQKMVIADKIVAHTSLNPTKAVYAARVVYNAMKDAGFITDEKSGGKKGTALISEPTEEEVEEVADTATDEVVAEIEKPEKEKITIDDDEITTFFKSADFPVEDVTPEEEGALYPAWNSLPDDKDIEWTDLCKLVGMSTATKLKNIQAILPSDSTSKEEEEGTPFIEDEDQIDDEDLTDTDRVISRGEVERELSPNFRFSGSPYRDMND
jgi:hypothetical protein